MKPCAAFCLLIAALLWINLPSEAQNPPKKTKYTIKRGDTVTGIARKFGMKPQDVLMLNSIKNPNSIREGQEILVFDKQAVAVPVVPVMTASSSPVKTTTVETKRYHVVMQGETLNSIARNYNTTVANLMRWNNLNTTNTGLKLGQKLIVGDLKDNVKSEKFFSGKGRIVNERGMAMMINGVDADLSVALHRTAPEGSMIRIYNESTKRAVLAKVIGKIPNVDSNKKVIVKLSKGACLALGAIDERFPVEVTYEK